MVNNKKLIALVSALLIVLSAIPSFAGGGAGGVGRATEMTQLANNTELASIATQELEQVSNQVTQITNQLNQYTEMLRHGIALPTSYINDVASQINSLKNAVQQTIGLYKSWGNMAESVEDMFNASLSGTALENMATRSNQSVATLKAIARKLDQTQVQIETDNGVIQKILNRSANAEGRMQAIQASTEMAAATAQEINKLRTDVDTLTSLCLSAEVARQLSLKEEASVYESLTSIEMPKSTITTEYDK